MIGFGYDVHRLEKGNTLILGGVNIKSDYGSIAHSDGDVLWHSIIDALLGASGLGDIGEHFPDNDSNYKNADSTLLAAQIIKLIKSKGFKIVNIDTYILLEAPKLKSYKYEIRHNVATICGIDIERVNIKAGTNEKMGFIGRNEGIAAYSVCQLEKIT